MFSDLCYNGKCQDSGFCGLRVFFCCPARVIARSNRIFVGGRNASCSEDTPSSKPTVLAGSRRNEQEASLHL